MEPTTTQLLGIADINESIVLKIENELIQAIEVTLNVEDFDNFLLERRKFWSDHLDLFITLEKFKKSMDLITRKVVESAITRKFNNKPAMADQTVNEHLEHMLDHVDLWKNNDKGDEFDVLEQAKHVLCRCMLAYYCYACEVEKSKLLDTEKV